MKPPKCRLCGKEEWRHVCSGAAELVARRDMPVTHRADSVTHNEPAVTHKPSSAERQRRWREAHKDVAKAATRERMKRRRAKG